ncbi:MAG: antitoxin [Actinomycetota bacterium]|nr:antitoxin [Actinomycetota bacterium]
MRTTVTLDPDVEALVRKVMEERGVSFKQALNDAIRAGLAPTEGRGPYRLKPAHLGRAAVPLTKALQLAAELEDDEIARKLALGK